MCASGGPKATNVVGCHRTWGNLSVCPPVLKHLLLAMAKQGSVGNGPCAMALVFSHMTNTSAGLDANN